VSRCRKHGVAVSCHCLMPNHVHFHSRPRPRGSARSRARVRRARVTRRQSTRGSRVTGHLPGASVAPNVRSWRNPCVQPQTAFWRIALVRRARRSKGVRPKQASTEAPAERRDGWKTEAEASSPFLRLAAFRRSAPAWESTAIIPATRLAPVHQCRVRTCEDPERRCFGNCAGSSSAAP